MVDGLHPVSIYPNSLTECERYIFIPLMIRKEFVVTSQYGLRELVSKQQDLLHLDFYLEFL